MADGEELRTDAIVGERDGDIATLSLSNPDRLKAMTGRMWRRVGEAMRELSADDDLRCIVLRGAGDRAFAAGADISAFAEERKDVAQAAVYHKVIDEAMRAAAECRHPTVALIQGVCVGGGLRSEEHTSELQSL